MVYGLTVVPQGNGAHQDRDTKSGVKQSVGNEIVAGHCSGWLEVLQTPFAQMGPSSQAYMEPGHQGERLLLWMLEGGDLGRTTYHCISEMFMALPKHKHCVCPVCIKYCVFADPVLRYHLKHISIY